MSLAQTILAWSNLEVSCYHAPCEQQLPFPIMEEAVPSTKGKQSSKTPLSASMIRGGGNHLSSCRTGARPWLRSTEAWLFAWCEVPCSRVDFPGWVEEASKWRQPTKNFKWLKSWAKRNQETWMDETLEVCMSFKPPPCHPPPDVAPRVRTAKTSSAAFLLQQTRGQPRSMCSTSIPWPPNAST